MLTIRSTFLSVLALALSGCEGFDGRISRDDVCFGAHDWLDLDEAIRPRGGDVVVAGALADERRAALLRAAEIRAEQTRGAADWRLHFDGPDEVESGENVVLFASCSLSDKPLASEHGHGAWAYVTWTGGLGVAWDDVEPELWADLISWQLAALEGGGRPVRYGSRGEQVPVAHR